MTPEAQRIAIAEACGWFPCRSSYPCEGFHRYGTEDKPGDGTVVGQLPDYLNDLNAMHEAVKCLDKSKHEHVSYAYKLEELTTYDEIGQVGHILALSEATSAQRAEAFLRTIGKRVERMKMKTKTTAENQRTSQCNQDHIEADQQAYPKPSKSILAESISNKLRSLSNRQCETNSAIDGKSAEECLAG